MDRFSINSGAINSSVIRGTVVYLPSAETTFSRTLSERVSVFLKGTTAKSLGVTGDISKVFVIGSANTGFGINVTGSLARFTLKFLGSVDVAWGFNTAAALTIRKNLKEAFSAKSLTVTGTLDPRVLLSGATEMKRTQTARLHSRIRLNANPVALARKPEGTITLTGGLKGTLLVSRVPSGNLARGVRNPFGLNTLTKGVALEGNLRGLFRFHGLSAKQVALTGDLNKAQRMQGLSQKAVENTADLSNNAATGDLKDFLMIRKPTDREMSR